MGAEVGTHKWVLAPDSSIPAILLKEFMSEVSHSNVCHTHIVYCHRALPTRPPTSLSKLLRDYSIFRNRFCGLLFRESLLN